MSFYVIKLGGSLIGSARDLMKVLFSLSQEGYSFLVVPGGGPMADLVRELFSMYSISQEAAHWMAVLAMEQYAYLLADGTGAKLTARVQRAEGVRVLLPYDALREDDGGIEHSWDYTSDSVAVLAAVRLRAPLIKATDVDGVILGGEVVKEIAASSLMGMESCIDQGALRLLKASDRSCWVLNGAESQRFVAALKTGEGGTIIRGC
ncbi:MAG: acetylglutamate kinase [Methanosaeta sp. PtaU1.Bin060]|nr:MAG: acetylglutamate kinase [Methanosaeta sp. PtaU1.Bin060]